MSPKAGTTASITQCIQAYKRAAATYHAAPASRRASACSEDCGSATMPLQLCTFSTVPEHQRWSSAANRPQKQGLEATRCPVHHLRCKNCDPSTRRFAGQKTSVRHSWKLYSTGRVREFCSWFSFFTTPTIKRESSLVKRRRLNPLYLLTSKELFRTTMIHTCRKRALDFPRPVCK